MRRLPVVLFALFALVATACDDGGGGLEAPAAMPSMPDGAVRESAPADAAPRQEIVTGYLQLTADDPVAVGRQVAFVVENADGRVDSATEQPEQSSVLTVRVPAARLDGVIDEIRSLGRVTSLSTSRDDVTMQYTDLEARAGALRASVDRLRALLESSTNTADLIEAENALAQRQADLDSLEAQRRAMADMIDLSTLTVDIDTERRPSDEDSFVDGLVSGWNSLWSTLGASIVALGVALPWVAFLIVCAGVVYLVVRIVARRGRETGTSGEPPTERTDTDA